MIGGANGKNPIPQTPVQNPKQYPPRNPQQQQPKQYPIPQTPKTYPQPQQPKQYPQQIPRQENAPIAPNVPNVPTTIKESTIQQDKNIVNKPAPPGPFITNVAKDVFQKRKEMEKPKFAQPSQQTIKLEIPYPEISNMPQTIRMEKDEEIMRYIRPLYPGGPTQEIYIPRVTNIQIPGPTQNGHIQMARIYDDILPGKENQFTFNSLGERINIRRHLRGSFVSIHDGENIDLTGRHKKSLLSFLKIVELNPTYYSTLTDNPYKNLPMGMLLYRSCYPQNVDDNSKIKCSKFGIGINTRLYMLSVAEYYSYHRRDYIFREYDVWREVMYYDYVHYEILDKKMCPNFVMYYAYYTSQNAAVDFFKLKNATADVSQKEKLTKEYQRYMTLNKIGMPQMAVEKSAYENIDRKYIIKLPDEIDPTLQIYSGHCLIILTEAPHHNFYTWASRIYENQGTVKKMVSHGYYSENIWLNVIFQLMVALYVMQIKGIYIRDMTLGDNVYIKDLHAEGSYIGFWKYIINGMEYYIPNYGYLLQIDTNYKDIIPDGTIIPQDKRFYKIYCNKFYDKTRYKEDYMKKLILTQNFKKILNPNSFTNEHRLNGVNKPSNKIIALLEKISNDPSEDIGEIIYNNMKMFLHNRIGTFINTNEKEKMRSEMYKNFKKGELVIQEIKDDFFKWAMFIGKDVNDDGYVKILTKDDVNSNDIVEQNVRIETLRQYNPVETVEQIYKFGDAKFTEDNLLEIYTINHN
jgi:hypothetical protein